MLVYFLVNFGKQSSISVVHIISPYKRSNLARRSMLQSWKGKIIIAKKLDLIDGHEFDEGMFFSLKVRFPIINHIDEYGGVQAENIDLHGPGYVSSFSKSDNLMFVSLRSNEYSNYDLVN